MKSLDARFASPVWSALTLHLDLAPDAITEEQTLTELGLDGLDRALVAMRISDWLRVDVPLPLVEHAVTVGDLARAVATLMSELDEDGRPSIPTAAPPVRPRSGTHVALARGGEQKNVRGRATSAGR